MTDAPENAAPHLTAPAPAPVRARAVAGLIDLALCAAVIWLLNVTYPQNGVLVGLVLVVAAFSALESHGGQTLGKRLLRLEVRYLDGAPCDVRAAVIRNAFRFLDAFPGIYLIGGFAIAGNKRRQRLGDQAAGTSVYRQADLVTLPSDA